MLSALIRSEHSYPAVLLAEQLVDQRFVHSGPLVTLSIITNGADYIFTLRLAALTQGKPSKRRGRRIMAFLCAIFTPINIGAPVVTGSDLKLKLNLVLFSWF